MQSPELSSYQEKERCTVGFLLSRKEPYTHTPLINSHTPSPQLTHEATQPHTATHKLTFSQVAHTHTNSAHTLVLIHTSVTQSQQFGKTATPSTHTHTTHKHTHTHIVNLHTLLTHTHCTLVVETGEEGDTHNRFTHTRLSLTQPPIRLTPGCTPLHTRNCRTTNEIEIEFNSQPSTR